MREVAPINERQNPRAAPRPCRSIREAHRGSRLDGELHICEPESYFGDLDGFCAGLSRLGFEVLRPKTEGSFVRIRALENVTVPAPDLVLPFRKQG